MKQWERHNLLLIAPTCDGTDVGESFSSFQWVLGLSQRHDVTVLTYSKRDHISLREQLPDIEVVEWEDLPLVGRFERFNSMFKPGYFPFYHRARAWVRSQLRKGRRFEVAHQLAPLAPRYPTPVAGLGIPYILGPVGGCLPTPATFKRETRSNPWHTGLRAIDRWRFRADPLLRKTISSAEVVLGVAPYMRDVLADIPVKRFEVMSETGISGLALNASPRPHQPDQLRLLYIGRVVRQKGLRDALRAMARLSDRPEISLDVVGDGPDLPLCRQVVKQTGIESRVRFHGRQPRDRIDAFYAQADIFLFPSFREASGNVVHEAMAHGLPVVTSNRGGPGYIVDDTSGVRVELQSPNQYANDIAGAIRGLANDRTRITRLSKGASKRVESIGLWPNKIDWMCRLYDSVLNTNDQAILKMATSDKESIDEKNTGKKDHGGGVKRRPLGSTAKAA